MNDKGLAEINNSIETPNKSNYVAEKPIKSEKILKKRVDINDLKSKLQENENREFRKNLFVLSTLVIGLGALGIYLSL